MNIIGDVEGKNVLLVDDLIDTGGTFVGAINALKNKGAKKIWGSVSHALLSGESVSKIEASPIDELYVTDTIPLTKESSKIKIRTASALFAEAIIRSHNNTSISSLFDVDKG
jgi:ribose-phosphate pyrophosphokinase